MTTISPLYIKGASAVVIAGVLDRFICGETDMMQNAYFGVSTGLGIGLGSYISSMIPAILPDSSGLYTGSALQSRVIEVGGGLAATYVVSKYMTKQNNNISLSSKVLVVLATDFISEYIADYATTQPLAYLQ